MKSPGIDAVYIGTDPASEVYIKWGDMDEYVKEKHAKMIYENEQVWIESIGDAEVLVNNRVIRERKSLEGGDKILLGTQSISLIQFNARTKGKSEVPNTPNDDNSERVAVRITPRK